MQAPGKGQFQAGIPVARAVGVAEVNPAVRPRPPKNNSLVTNAIGNAANAIIGVGNLAEELQQEQERQFMAEAELKMSKASADLQLSLVGRANPQDHVELAREKYSSLKEEVLTNGRYSPRFEKIMAQRLDLFVNQKIEKITLDARLAQVENGKRLLLARVANYQEQGDFGAARTAIKEGTEIYWAKEDEQAAMLKTDRAEANQNLAKDIKSDPKGTEERLKDEANYPHLNPVARMDAQDGVKREIRELTAAAVDSFRDDLATGAIGKHEDIDAKFGGLRPSILEQMKGELDARLNKAEMARRQTPEYQNEVIGKVTSMLASYEPEMDEYDERQTEIQMMASRLIAGPAKTNILKRIEEVRTGKIREFEDHVELARENLTSAYRDEFFGKTKVVQSVQESIDRGLLQDADSFATMGLSEDAVAAIAKGKTKAEQAEIFRTELGKIPSDKVALAKLPSPKRMAYEAVRDRKGPSTMIEWVSPEEEKRAQQGLGEAIRKLDVWAKLAPEKAKDEAEVKKKIYEIISPRGVAKFEESMMPAMVLPPLTPAEEVPNFLDQ